MMIWTNPIQGSTNALKFFGWQDVHCTGNDIDESERSIATWSVRVEIGYVSDM